MAMWWSKIQITPLWVNNSCYKFSIIITNWVVCSFLVFEIELKVLFVLYDLPITFGIKNFWRWTQVQSFQLFWHFNSDVFEGGNCSISVDYLGTQEGNNFLSFSFHNIEHVAAQMFALELHLKSTESLFKMIRSDKKAK